MKRMHFRNLGHISTNTSAAAHLPAMNTVSTPAAPAAIGPYTQGCIVNGMLFTAGQIALVPETMELVCLALQLRAETSSSLQCTLWHLLRAHGHFGLSAIFAWLMMHACPLVYRRRFASRLLHYCCQLKQMPSRLCKFHCTFHCATTACAHATDNTSLPTR